MTAAQIIENSIAMLTFYFDTKEDAIHGVNMVIGKIALALELELINIIQSDQYINDLMLNYENIQKY